jgi:4-hydroxy-tetrahydrodipicolinate reductase
MTPVHVVVTGVGGRMGSRVASLINGDPDFRLVGATERPDSPLLGEDAGLAAGGSAAQVRISPSIEEALQTKPDVVIDFTAPAPSMHHARACANAGVALVVGTTGFSQQQKAELAEHARKAPILLAPNMSIGVNVLFRLVEQAVAAFGSSIEVEIVELHHRDKKDAPSGTALRLAEVAASGLRLDAAKALVVDRHGPHVPRRPGTIGIQALRGGDAVGDHTVHLLADGERIELTHRATSRDNFARGALRAARFIAGKPARLYGMQDVLGDAT